MAPLTPPELAVILAVPGAARLASKVVLTVAAALFEELQLTWLVMFCVLPSLYVPVAVI